MYMYVHSRLNIFKKATFPMVTMNVQKIFFYLIVMKLYRNDPWGV